MKIMFPKLHISKAIRQIRYWSQKNRGYKFIKGKKKEAHQLKFTLTVEGEITIAKNEDSLLDFQALIENKAVEKFLLTMIFGLDLTTVSYDSKAIS